jgi:alkyl hydroperoxide reductase subunit D
VPGTSNEDIDMTLDQIKERIPDYARDLKLNLGSVLTPQGAPGLTEAQQWMTALATAIASGNGDLTRAVESAAAGTLRASTPRARRRPSWA